jgi:hypothetical protein
MLMRKNLLAFLIVIIILVLNVVLVCVLVQETDGTRDGAYHFPSLEVAVKSIPRSSTSDLSNLLSVPSSSFSDSSFSPSPEKLAITRVEENVSSSTFVVTVSNDDSQNISIDSIFVNYCSAKLENKVIIPAFSSVNLLFTFSEGIAFGHTYEIRILSAEGFFANYFKIMC